MAKPTSNPKKRVLKALKEDSEYQKFKRIYKRIVEVLTVEKFVEEAKALHAGRTSRKLYDQKQFRPRALLEAAAKDTAVRSRLVEIRVRISESQSKLDEAMDAMKRYMNTEFYDELSEYKTQDIKKSLVDRVMTKPLEVMSDIKNLLDILDVLIKDVDQTGYQLKIMMEALKLLSEAKGGKLV